MSDSPAVEIKNCRKRLGRSGLAQVVFELEKFRLSQESWLALTGPSGCGKSTFLNLLAGMIRPDSGEIKVFGEPITTLSNAALDRYRGKTIGFIFQSFNLLDAFNAEENVALGMRFGHAREGRARARDLLSRVGLSHRMKSRPSRLSVGERQRVSIARALANRPKLLLADEPTGALDPTTADSVFDLIMELCEEERCALLFVTHDMELANRLPGSFDCRGLIAHREGSAATA